MKTIIVLALCVFAISNSYARRGKIKIKEALRTELNAVLKSTSDLHQACVKQNDEQVATSIRRLLINIERANKKSVLAANQQTHLVKILNAAKREFEMSQVMSGNERRKRLKSAFGQIVQIAKVYQVDRYRIFFCSKDRSVWIQKSWKAKNPVHPKQFANCGQLVR